MKNCNCNDINISQAGLKLGRNTMQVVLTREPDTPLIKQLRQQIEELRQIGLDFQDVDRKIADKLEEMDVVTKAYLAEVLENLDDFEQLKQSLKEWADSRFMRKLFLSQAAYDALGTKEENVLYCII